MLLSLPLLLNSEVFAIDDDGQTEILGDLVFNRLGSTDRLRWSACVYRTQRV